MTPQGGLSKSLAVLERKDFASYPIWECELTDSSSSGDKWDESHVHPIITEQIPKNPSRHYLVSARFTLKSGIEIPGCVEVMVADNRIHCVPLFVYLLDRHLEVVGHETDRLLSRYTNYPNNRPIKWQLVPLVEGENKQRRGNVHRSLLYLLVRFVFGFVTRSR